MSKKAYMIEIDQIDDFNKDGSIDLKDIGQIIKSKKLIKQLKGDGDFRSDECIQIMQKADVIVTNPPFSLFREFVNQIIEYNKYFIILGNQNAFTYKEIFSLIQKNIVWTGYKNGDMAFRVPNYYEPRSTRFWIDEDGNKWRSFGNITWFTNIDVKKRHENIILYKKYNPDEYPKFDNYDAINVNKVTDIPCDYEGLMGVPITFLEKYNPNQFEIIDALNRYALLDIQNTNTKVQKEHSHTCNINGKPTYFRVVIKKKIGEDNMPEIQGLRSAQKNKNDEFYTSLEDIEKEMRYYREQFNGKIVLCNCDDPYESNFFKYFALNFNSLKLKKLICTCYDGSPIMGEQISFFNEPKNIEISKKAYKLELTQVDDFNQDGATDLEDITQIFKI